MRKACAPCSSSQSKGGLDRGMPDRYAPFVEPKLPKDISPFARACLDALAVNGLGRHVSIGGAFGLAHYHEYRPTRDVGAWWREPISREKRAAVVEVLEKTLKTFGSLRTRAWGDVTSVEVEKEGRTIFSFQVATRSAQLEEPVVGLWPGGIGVDTLDELIASKMRALVERGAPRDFRDIHAVCSAGLCSARRCWELWGARQRLAGEDADSVRARKAIATHLSRLEIARPLDRLADPERREQASRLRAWYQQEFIGELQG